MLQSRKDWQAASPEVPLSLIFIIICLQQLPLLLLLPTALLLRALLVPLPWLLLLAAVAPHRKNTRRRQELPFTPNVLTQQQRQLIIPH
jgi:hypothetical protein